MVNDTDLNVDFEYPNQSLMETRRNDLKHENMLDTTFSRCNNERVNIDIDSDADSVIEEEVKPLSRTELRNKRLAFFNK